MAVTAALVESKPNHLRYLVTSDGAGGTVNITSTGAASPDLQTDTKGASPLKKLSRAEQDGLGQLAAGALTQADARAIWMGDSADTVLGVKVPRAHTNLSPRDGATSWLVDANVDGGGVPELVITADANVGNAYLDVFYPGAIGL